jgi:hypothetical protein
MMMYYLCTPQTHADSNLLATQRLVTDLIKQGHQTYCPVLHNVGLYTRVGWRESQWQYYNEWFMEKCDLVLVAELPGWRDSQRVRQEIMAAGRLNKTIVYLDPNSPIEKRSLKHSLIRKAV